MCADHFPAQTVVNEGYFPVKGAELYYRDVGQGLPIVILHGGPDFGHSYLLPDMDRLSDAYRLIYYDQRGRGESARDVQPEDVTLASEIADLEGLREYLRLESVAVLGHSWGGLLAMEYALRHPGRVSHLILLNTAPASRNDYMLFRQARRQRAPGDIERLQVLAAGAGYQDGDPGAVVEYYGVHYRATLRKPELLERLIQSLRSNFTQERILKGRAIEDRLMADTWLAEDYDLVPQLARLTLPTLVIHGDYDLVPVECAVHIVQAIPAARFVLLADCGHFAYLERPDEVRKAIDGFMG